MRRAARKDALHGAIGKLFRDHGWDALDLSLLGDGCPDWLMARGTLAFLVEVKTPATFGHQSSRFDAQGRNENQIEFHRKWKSQIHIVSSLEEGWTLLDATRHSKPEMRP